LTFIEIRRDRSKSLRYRRRDIHKPKLS